MIAPCPETVTIEAARMLRHLTAWERNLRHFDVLCDAGVPADRALEIIELASADREAEITTRRAAA